MSTPKPKESGYCRPKKTYTDNLSESQIIDLLKGYERVRCLDASVPIGTHIRYFKKTSNGGELFRIGGSLFKNGGLPDYVVLTNGKNTWSVQTKDAKFFKKLSEGEIVNLYDGRIEALKERVKALKGEVRALKAANSKRQQ